MYAYIIYWSCGFSVDLGIFLQKKHFGKIIHRYQSIAKYISLTKQLLFCVHVV